jgi:hypothetical protein
MISEEPQQCHTKACSAGMTDEACCSYSGDETLVSGFARTLRLSTEEHNDFHE